MVATPDIALPLGFLVIGYKLFVIRYLPKAGCKPVIHNKRQP